MLSLQTIWLYNTYTLFANSIYKESCEIIEKAIDREATLVLKRMPKGTEIMSGSTNSSIPSTTYLVEGISKMGYEMSLNDIDSITTVLLKESNIRSNSMICIVNPQSKVILQKSKDIILPDLGIIKSDAFPIKTDLSQGIQLVLLNPYWTIFQRMALLMIATVIMMAFVIGCIVYQVKIIARQNRIAKKREDFSYAMIHDMKTPLSSIMMAADSLHSGKLDGKPEIKEKFFTIIGSEVEHLLKLTNKVLTLSKLESDKLEMNKTVIQIEPIITGLEEMFSTKTRKKVVFVNELEEKEVYADEEFLKEAISNLMDNAIKYSKDSVEITVSSVRNASYSLIKVHDNGIGISPKDQRRIFNKFERAAAAMKRTKQGGPSGFGLGLNYVYQVMDAHGGEVTVNSMEGEFSEFTLYIPQLIKELQND